MSIQTTRTLWEVPYISCQNVLNVNRDKFNYQMILRGVESNQNTYYSISRVKVFPCCIYLDNRLCTFTTDPFKKISETVIKGVTFSVKWGEFYCKKSVLTKEELTPEEQLNLHLVMLENFIENKILPEIYLQFRTARRVRLFRKE